MKVFVAALDWGLGHATRSVSIIEEQIKKKHTIIIGASKNQMPVYREHFPTIPIIEMPSAPPRYSPTKNQFWALLFFIPKFYKLIQSENRTLKDIIKKHKINMVISDNCYGLYNKKVKNIIVTHQVSVILPKPLRFLNRFVNFKIRSMLNKFDECWIPDYPSPNNLAGKLSIPSPRLQCNIKFIGAQSRLKLSRVNPLKNKPELVVLISGPEKQRSVFEDKILGSIRHLPCSVSFIIVRGLPASSENNIKNSKNHVSAEELKSLLIHAKYIIARAGYSTIMDLSLLGKTAMLVPTPGQPEQEYLAGLLMNKGLFLSVSQYDFELGDAIEKLKHFTPQKYQFAQITN